MITIGDKLMRILETKIDIRLAIKNKGVSVNEDDLFSSYADKIGEIEGGGGAQISEGIEWAELNDRGYPTSAKHFSSNNSIKANEFRSMIWLTSVILSNNIKTIYTSAFADCTALNLTSLPINLELIESSAFYGCRKIKLSSTPLAIKSIPNSCFYACVSIESMSMPGVNAIEASAFQGCSNLESVEIGSAGNPVTDIHARSFYLCGKLTNVTIYVDDPSTGLLGSPWGATKATIKYMQA